MVWVGISSRGITSLVFIDGNLDGSRYVQILEEHLLPLIENQFLENDHHAHFQRDHASSHTGKVAQDFFTTEATDVLLWAPKSPDLNITEKFWGLLVGCVNYGYRQFETLDDLRERLELEWDKIDLHTIRNFCPFYAAEVFASNSCSRCSDSLLDCRKVELSPWFYFYFDRNYWSYFIIRDTASAPVTSRTGLHLNVVVIRVLRLQAALETEVPSDRGTGTGENFKFGVVLFLFRPVYSTLFPTLSHCERSIRQIGITVTS